MSESEQEPDVFEVAEILQRSVAHGTEWYLVHWKGYDDPKDNTWEPIDNLTSCLDLVAEFHERQSRTEKVVVPRKSRRKTEDSDDGFELSDAMETKEPKKTKHHSSADYHRQPKQTSPRAKIKHREASNKTKEKHSKSSTGDRVKRQAKDPQKMAEIARNVQKKFEMVDEDVCDEWFAATDNAIPEALPPLVPSPAKVSKTAVFDHDWRGEVCETIGIGWKVSEILSAKRNYSRIYYECLFQNGIIRWVDSSTVKKLNSRLVADFLSECIGETLCPNM